MKQLTSTQCEQVTGGIGGIMGAIADFITLEGYGYSKQQLAVIQGIRVTAICGAGLIGGMYLAQTGGIAALTSAAYYVGIPCLAGYATFSYVQSSSNYYSNSKPGWFS